MFSTLLSASLVVDSLVSWARVDGAGNLVRMGVLGWDCFVMDGLL